MQRLFWLLGLLGWAGLSLNAQHHYGWKIGLHSGLSHYYGDLSQRIVDFPQHFEEES